MESLRPQATSWTTKEIKTKDPRMKNMDLLSKTWLTDTRILVS
jgi:hypothetical protein